MYHEYTQEELRSYCRSCIESLEVWARRLVHEKMTESFGANYVDVVRGNGQPLIKTEIKSHIREMMAREPERFKRPVDTLFIDQIIYFLCNQAWYGTLFKPALDYAYPQGCAEAREFLSRLVPIRNPLSHSNPISIRQVEQAICYSHDFIDGLKRYYKDRGEEQVWNVPKIIKVTDSLGNVFDNIVERTSLGASVTIPQMLQSGDIYTVEVEIDTSFRPEDYTIKWQMRNKNTRDFDNKTKYTVSLTPQDVGQTTLISCTIIQNKPWHKYGNHDSRVNVHLTVLPPVDT